jgi:bidirectional [NiFe] hydrogenase diaphorase subunit
LSWVYGVATFYHFFSLEPQGEHTCIVCMGTACYVKRAAEILSAVQSTYGIEAGQITGDGKLSLQTARCLGSCGLAPLIVLDGEVMGKLTPEVTLERVDAMVRGQAAPGAATSQETKTT